MSKSCVSDLDRKKTNSEDATRQYTVLPRNCRTKNLLDAYCKAKQPEYCEVVSYLAISEWVEGIYQ
ncbi:hypothetical protein M514_04003 [Trichuris suis]|uniref:Uncharacterized protein n=1 Tax=Trichuris suis TaxID=68888 RepID=A0A085MCY9_9BILA|nr:hypothetical protein M513_04003 [Trichuris suis]KFD72556.1 hypothetical protein M514_04003 [Trichuris suis]